MSQANLTKHDNPKQGDGLKALFSKSKNRLANLSDLMEEPICKDSKIIMVYFKPATRVLYVPNSGLRMHEAKMRGINTISVHGVPRYSADDLLKHKLIDSKLVKGFQKRTDELMKHFIMRWTQ